MESIKLTILVMFTLIGYIAHATTYDVGPGKPYSSILEISTHNLQAGDSIKVFYRAMPYYEKFLLHGIGTQSNPIVLVGIPDANGNKPVIDGKNALSNLNSNYWNEERQVLLIGQGQLASDYIIVEGLVIQGANNYNIFADDSGKQNIQYAANACGIRISSGKNITIRNCDIIDNGIGIQSGKMDNMNLLVEYCNVFDNGKCTWSNSYIHNFYLSSGANSEVIVQYCHIGELLSNGQQFRSRAHTTVFRYNWIEGGRNSALDLMQGDNLDENMTHNAYVYGNIIVKPDNAQNARIIHFGTDKNSYNRLGTCYFYNNTVVIKDTKTWGTRRIFKLSGNAADIISDNNIFYKSDNITYELLDGPTGSIVGSDNWFSNNINGISLLTNSLSGTDPNFIDYSNDNFQLDSNSSCLDILASYAYPTNHDLANQYVKHTQSKIRPINGNIDLGAFERASPLTSVTTSFLNEDFVFYPNPTNAIVRVDAENIIELAVFDVNGQFVKGNKFKSLIDLTELKPSIYFLKVMSNNAEQIVKIIKK